jgi:hypothetical protein
VGEIRSYQGSRGEIINGYASQSVKDAGKIHVAFVENDSILSEDAVSPPNPLNTLAGWEIPPIELEQPLYVIYIFIIEYQGARNLDCR